MSFAAHARDRLRSANRPWTCRMEMDMTTSHAPRPPAATAYEHRMDTISPPLDLYAASPGTLLTETQLAASLGVASKTLRNWRSSKSGPAWRNLGGALVRYRAGEVVEWIESHDG